MLGWIGLNGLQFVRRGIVQTAHFALRFVTAFFKQASSPD